MTGVANYWPFVAGFFGFVLSTIVETEWLNRRTDAGVSRSFLVAFTSNTFAIILGYFFFYWVMVVAFFVAGVGSASGMPPPWYLLVLWMAVILGFAVPPLAIAKRLLLKITKTGALTRPWIYAILASFAFQISFLGLSFLAAYFT